MTDCRMPRNFRFSVKEAVVGGTVVVMPIQRSLVGGSVGRSERSLLLVESDPGVGNIN